MYESPARGPSGPAHTVTSNTANARFIVLGCSLSRSTPASNAVGSLCSERDFAGNPRHGFREMKPSTTGGSCPLWYTSLPVTGSLVNVVVGPLAVPGLT
jgi:hypothetical protein